MTELSRVIKHEETIFIIVEVKEMSFIIQGSFIIEIFRRFHEKKFQQINLSSLNPWMVHREAQ